MNVLFATSYHPLDFGLLLLRIVVAIVFLVHAREKASSWRDRVHSHRSQRYVRVLQAFAVVEPICSLAVMAGAYTRITAWGLAAISLGAIYYKIELLHAPFSASDRTGWELDAVLLAASAALVFAGGGAFSIDAMRFGQ
jgi:uncharacterized membrane protein YphA (DoxX/SURF4 family)